MLYPLSYEGSYRPLGANWPRRESVSMTAGDVFQRVTSSSLNVHSTWWPPPTRNRFGLSLGVPRGRLGA